MQSPHKKSFAAEQLRQRQKKSPATIAIIVLAVVIAVGAVGYALYVRFGEKEVPSEAVTPAEEKITIAVLPFEDLSDAQDQKFFGKGVAESIINKLTNVERLRVFSRTSSFEFKNIDKPIVEQCKEHGVDWLLEGSVRKSGNTLRITAQLIQVKDQTHVFSYEEDKDITDIFAVQTEIAMAVLREMKFSLMGKEQAAIAKQYTNDPDAYELYLKGQEEDDGTLKLALYEQAIKKDPAFVLAYAKIADIYNSSGYSGEKEFFQKAKDMAQKALEIDSTLAEAHAEIAWYSMYNDWDWEAAEQALQRAVTHNPGYAKAYRYYRDYYLIMGDVARAIEMVERAHAVDPLSEDAATFMVFTYVITGKHEKAYEKYKELIQQFPDARLLLTTLGHIYWVQGNYKEGLEIIGKYYEGRESAASYKFMIAYAYAKMGEKDSAEQILEDIIARNKQDSIWIAGIYLALGNLDKTFEWLDRAYEERDVWVLNLKTHWWWEPIRTDPRYTVLLKKLNLPVD